MMESLEGDAMQIRVDNGQGQVVIDREALRQQIRQSVEQARQAAQEARSAAAEANGIQVRVIDPPAVPGGTHAGTPIQFPMDLPPNVANVSYMFFVTIAAVLILRPLMSAFGRRLERRPAAAAALPPEMTQQISRIEQTVEAMAIEIERISEGQRFTAKLLAEREREKLPIQAG